MTEQTFVTAALVSYGLGMLAYAAFAIRHSNLYIDMSGGIGSFVHS